MNMSPERPPVMHSNNETFRFRARRSPTTVNGPGSSAFNAPTAITFPSSSVSVQCSMEEVNDPSSSSLNLSDVCKRPCTTRSASSENIPGASRCQSCEIPPLWFGTTAARRADSWQGVFLLAQVAAVSHSLGSKGMGCQLTCDPYKSPPRSSRLRRLLPMS